jgi:hypothetical protein
MEFLYALKRVKGDEEVFKDRHLRNRKLDGKEGFKSNF